MNTASKVLLLVLLFAAPAFAQNVRVDNVTFSSVQGFPFLPGATITICTAAATGLPCSPTVAGTCLSISDVTCNQSATLTSDAFGNYGFWIQPGSYSYTVTKAGFGGFGPRALTLACQPTATCTMTAPQTINSNLTVSGTGTFNAFSSTGTMISTSPSPGLASCRIENVRYVDSANSCGWAGVDVKDWINSAYADCPTSTSSGQTGSGGCEVFVAPFTGGGCYTAATTGSILFSTNLKLVTLVGSPGGATCINFTTSGNTAVSLSSASEASNTATYTFASNANCLSAQGSTGVVTVAGVTPSGYNGQWKIASNCGGGTSLTATIQTAGLGAGSGGTVTSTFFAVILNTGSPNTNSLYYRNANGIRDIRFVGSSSSGPVGCILVGGTNGAEGAWFPGLTCETFGTDIQIDNNAFNLEFGAVARMQNSNTMFYYPPGVTGSGEHIDFDYSFLSNSPTQANCVNISNVTGPVDLHFLTDDIDACQVAINNANGGSAGVHFDMVGGHFEDPGIATAYDYIAVCPSCGTATSNNNAVSLSRVELISDNTTSRSQFMTINGGTASLSGVIVTRNGGGAVQATHIAQINNNAQVSNYGLKLSNTPISGTRFNFGGASPSQNLIDCDATTASPVGCFFTSANSFAFGVTQDGGSVSHLSNNGDFLTSNTTHQVQVTGNITTAGTACTNGELLLSGGWQSTGTATVTAAAGQGQTCSWTITTGTTTAANPTVTDTLTNALPTATTVCWMTVNGGTHTPVVGAGTSDAFRQTTLSATAPVFTYQETPTAGGTTYFVTRSCGP